MHLDRVSKWFPIRNHYLTITFFVLFIYFRFYKLEFQMEWDDYWVVINRYTTKGFNLENLKSVFYDFYHGQYSPINELYYILIFKFFGYNPFYYHLSSVMLHIFNSCLVYTFLNRISKEGFDFGINRSKLIALISAIFFAVHPLNVEPVSWISASKIPLYSTFYLMALLTYIRYIRSQKPKFLFFAFIFFLLSFGAKEQAVTFPLAVILLDFCYSRNLFDRKMILEKVVLFVTSLLLGVLTIASQNAFGNTFIVGYSFHERILLSFYSISLYASQAIFPIRLSYVYPFPFQPGKMIPLWLWIYPIIITISTVMLWRSIKEKAVLFALVFFTIHIGVALHIISLSRFSLLADRYMYLSLIGPSFLFGYIVSGLIEKAYTKRAFYLAGFGVVIISYIFYSSHRVKFWQNSKSLKESISKEIRGRKDFQHLRSYYQKNY